MNELRCSVDSVLYLYKLCNYDETKALKKFLIHLRNNGIMEMDRPPACYFASVQDGKQEIYLEWPYQFIEAEKLIHIRSVRI